MKHILIFLGIVVLGIALILAFTFTQQDEQDQVEIIDPTPSEPNYTIEEIPSAGIESIMPNLSRQVRYDASFPEDARAILNEQFTEITERLREDALRADDWFNLAIIYHTANDYEGARLIWEFLTEVIPNDSTAHDNLGKLYHFSLKDFPKSEASFRKSIELNPESIAPYIELHNLYRYSYKTNTSAGEDILRQAMVRFPDNFNLYLFLASYHADRGDRPRAREVLLEGMDKARDAGDVDAMAQIGAELERY